MTNQPQQPNPIQHDYYPDDEIELIDYLRVLWKWKWLIVMGTFLCALAAFIYGFTHPAVKMYKVSTLIEIDTKVTDTSKETDLPDKIKSGIESGIFDVQIMKDLSSSSAYPNIETLAFEISVFKGLSILHIVYETPYPDAGKAVLDSLVKQIKNLYEEKIGQTRSEIVDVVETKESFIKDIKERIMLTEKKNKKDIMVNKNRIKESAAKIEALKENIGCIENTMVYMKTALSKAESNAEKLAPQIDDALGNLKNGTDYENIDIQASAIQQLVNYPVTLKSQIDSLAWEKEKILVNILSEKNRIKELEAEIELLKAKSNMYGEKREIAKLKSEIESLKRDRDQVTAIIMRQNPTISPLSIKSTTKRNALLAGVAGLFFFVFLAFFIEYIKNASKSSPANKEI